jgi:GntR family transcriptional regulator
MIFRLTQSSGIPLYLQLMEQVKHAVETGALREGDQLPTIRKVAEELVMNPNTVVRAYRELEHEGVLELKHGSGAFIKFTKGSAGERAGLIREARAVAQAAVERLMELGLTEDEVRRVLDNELAQARAQLAQASTELAQANTARRLEGEPKG